MKRSLHTPDTFAARGALTVAEFCSWAAIGRSSFYREVKEGRIKLRKLGRKSVITMAEAEAWLNSLPVAE
jgi:predicted DNA-binding transcriptional regulator AlpA